MSAPRVKPAPAGDMTSSSQSVIGLELSASTGPTLNR